MCNLLTELAQVATHLLARMTVQHPRFVLGAPQLHGDIAPMRVAAGCGAWRHEGFPPVKQCAVGRAGVLTYAQLLGCLTVAQSPQVGIGGVFLDIRQHSDGVESF